MSDDVKLVLNGTTIQGWDDVRFTRGIERMPSDFELGMTERYAAELNNLRRVANPGDAMQLFVGNDLVITGYVDRITSRMSSSRHEVRLVGRGKCADLVDCAAEWPGGQIVGATALDVANKLCAVYSGGSLTVTTDVDVSTLPRIPQFNLNLGETAFEIIERICRYSGLLAYETPDGNLFLTRTSDIPSGSGLVEGKNIEEATYEEGQDRRYSSVLVYMQTLQTMADTGANLPPPAVVYDRGIARNRKLILISEQVSPGRDIALLRATWEANRRAGRSKVVNATCDSWRDGEGALWAPNRSVPVSAPTLKIPTNYPSFLISDVTYVKSLDGTHSYITLMPPYAFSVEPTLINPVSADLLPNQGYS